MKQRDLIKHVLAGKPLVIVEYRSFKEDTIRYRDKKTGNTIERIIIKHAVEMGANQVSVTEWLPDDAKPGMAKPPFTKGQRVILELEGMEREQAFYKASGTLFLLEEDTK